jgi:hypothetical protein
VRGKSWEGVPFLHPRWLREAPKNPKTGMESRSTPPMHSTPIRERFPPPWHIERCRAASVTDRGGTALAYIYAADGVRAPEARAAPRAGIRPAQRDTSEQPDGDAKGSAITPMIATKMAMRPLLSRGSGVAAVARIS